MTAAPFILQTGQPVMAMGGFSGGDPILTPASLAALVAKNDVRYFLISGNGRGFSLAQLPPDLRAILESGEFGGFGGFGNSGSSGSVTSWITSNCTLVPASAYGGAALAAVGGRAASSTTVGRRSRRTPPDMGPQLGKAASARVNGIDEGWRMTRREPADASPKVDP